MYRRILFCSVLALATTICPAWGAELSPFAVRNLSPFALVHGLAVAESARLESPGQLSARLAFDVANNATVNESGSEAIILDGETYVTTLGLRYGIADRFAVGLDLPWVAHNEGSLDSFIENWHKFFGLRNGDRGQLPDNQLDYAYTNHQDESLSLGDEASGIGDLRLSLAWQMMADEQDAVSLMTTVKAPTGDSGDLIGSGAWDMAIAISAQRDFSLSQGQAAIWGGLGGSWLGDGDILGSLAEDWAANAWLGAGWSPLNWLGLKLQLDSHTALYDSGLEELGDAALILTMGGTLAFSEATSLDLGVGEDLAVNASPDVTFHLSVSHKF